MLMEVKKRQEYYRELCGNCYSNEYADYIYTDEMGLRINPDYITRTFPRFLEKNGFPHMRFHDLRHPRVKLGLKNIFNFFNPHIRDRVPVFAHASVLQF